MAYLSVNKDGTEVIHDNKPRRIEGQYWDSSYSVENDEGWYDDIDGIEIELPKGSIKKLIGKELTWEDEPFEYK